MRETIRGLYRSLLLEDRTESPCWLRDASLCGIGKRPAKRIRLKGEFGASMNQMVAFIHQLCPVSAIETGEPKTFRQIHLTPPVTQCLLEEENLSPTSF